MPAMPAFDNDNPVLNIATEKVAFIVAKARACEDKHLRGDAVSGSAPIDNPGPDSPKDGPGDLAREKLADAIRRLNEEEQLNLVALAWLGRGTYDIAQWNTALDIARDQHNNRAAQYLIGLPSLSDDLEEGLAQFGERIGDDDAENP